LIAVDESLRQDAVKEFSLGSITIEAIPKQFLRSWLDPSLAGVDKEEMLHWVATTLEHTQQQKTKLKVTRKEKQL
jgi:hypothetical protein